MQNYSRNEVVLIRYPFSDLLTSKVRPAVIVSAPQTGKKQPFPRYREIDESLAKHILKILT